MGHALGRGGGSKYALVRQNKTLVEDFVANLRTVCHYLIFYLANQYFIVDK